MAFAYEIVEQQFGNIQNYADSAFDNAVEAIEALSQLLGEQAIETTPPSLPEIDITQSIDMDPAIEQVRTEILQAVDDMGEVSDPGDAPVTTEYDMPTGPVISWPVAPTLTDIVIPEFAENSIVGMTTSLPVFNLEVPELESLITESLAAAAIAPSFSELPITEAVHTQLKDNIENGGTMLNPLVEADIWNRDLEREEQALQDSVDKVTAQWAKFNFSVPDGLLSGNLLALNNEYMNRKIDRSRDIAIKQAELEQVGMFKSLELANTFSAMWFGVLESYKHRAFEFTKVTVDTLLSIYKERLNTYNVQLEAFKTDIIAWKTEIEREMVRAEVYKTRISGLQLIAGIDESRVRAYTAQIGAISELVKVWDTQIRAVAVMYELEKTKLEVYKTKVEAYSVKVDAVTKKFSAGMDGVKAFIGAWGASADVKTKLLDMQNRVNLASWDITMKQWEIETQTKERELSLRLDALKAAAQTSSNVAAGALSAAHASASASFGASTSTNYNHTFLD